VGDAKGRCVDRPEEDLRGDAQDAESRAASPRDGLLGRSGDDPATLAGSSRIPGSGCGVVKSSMSVGRASAVLVVRKGTVMGSAYNSADGLTVVRRADRSTTSTSPMGAPERSRPWSALPLTRAFGFLRLG
jgi:hypothetical protein